MFPNQIIKHFLLFARNWKRNDEQLSKIISNRKRFFFNAKVIRTQMKTLSNDFPFEKSEDILNKKYAKNKNMFRSK